LLPAASLKSTYKPTVVHPLFNPFKKKANKGAENVTTKSYLPTTWNSVVAKRNGKCSLTTLYLKALSKRGQKHYQWFPDGAVNQQSQSGMLRGLSRPAAEPRTGTQLPTARLELPTYFKVTTTQ